MNKDQLCLMFHSAAQKADRNFKNKHESLRNQKLIKKMSAHQMHKVFALLTWHSCRSILSFPLAW